MKAWLTFFCGLFISGCSSAPPVPGPNAAGGSPDGLTSTPAAPTKAAGITFAGGDGSSFERAILIKGAKGDQDGVASEYTWMRSNYPGSQPGEQSLQSVNGRNYDVINLQTPSGAKTIYFDITEYFGRF